MPHASCDDCGQVYKDIHGLQAHVKKHIRLDEEQRERKALDMMDHAQASK